MNRFSLVKRSGLRHLICAQLNRYKCWPAVRVIVMGKGDMQLEHTMKQELGISIRHLPRKCQENAKKMPRRHSAPAVQEVG